MLLVPKMECVLFDHAPPVFDAWSWCESDVLEWKLPEGTSLDCARPIEGENPPGLVFVLKRKVDWLPTELARLHAPKYGFGDELTLAPWAIDDATDLLYEHRVPPRDVFWLGATTLEALVWGLHDWVHFHNHGPFDQPALTELQCDLVALAWLRRNAETIGLGRERLREVAGDLAALSRTRFREESLEPLDFDELFRGPYPTTQLPTIRTAPTRTASSSHSATRS
jgi:hypothetical protein